MFAESDVDGEEAESDDDAEAGDRAQDHVDGEIHVHQLLLDHRAVPRRPDACAETPLSHSQRSRQEEGTDQYNSILYWRECHGFFLLFAK